MPSIRCARCGESIEVQNFQLVAVCPHCGWPPDLESYGSQFAKPDDVKPPLNFWKYDPRPPSLDSAERFFPGAVSWLMLFAKAGCALILVTLNYAIAAHVAMLGHPLRTWLVRIALSLSTVLFIVSYAFVNKLTFSAWGDWGFDYRGPRRRAVMALRFAAGLLQLVGVCVFFASG